MDGVEDTGEGVGGEVNDFVARFAAGEEPDDVGAAAFDGVGGVLVVLFEFGDGVFGV